MIDPNLIELEGSFLKALAQPTRLQILYFLKDGEQCQCKIIPRMKEDQSNISRHLTHMRDMGILESRREGVSVYYKIKDMKVSLCEDHILEYVPRNVKPRLRVSPAARLLRNN